MDSGQDIPCHSTAVMQKMGTFQKVNMSTPHFLNGYCCKTVLLQNATESPVTAHRANETRLLSRAANGDGQPAAGEASVVSNYQCLQRGTLQAQ